ncbi:hypothetical protein NJB14197_07060 [Mycobacterium montefiorense]|uniref:DUF3097 domain-containing protein n=3 Tax=Mycobacterium montefiorense TaxID=154654 RepID=A0AA37PKV2_9MYCO|nr:hypothetical protein MmonteBS_35870 [Mycobacterium montefiorense]GKU37312.1 hypothetical protein NJB14191_46580 [Mycobacterium montefiorense]GKU41960.1 hypothetical protein NJB14192_39430 [Mycobacterium montefiorense]GKU45578.1 hypothetical protein NJB14194_21990 [Mycobacterium montefiorense]GKU53460.1 hypothetical protein NJB14195_47010 [Mycobacterium montefiorense]
MDRYGTDVLAAGRRKPRSTEHPADLGLVVEDVETGYVGAVVRVEYGRIDLEDRHGHVRGFPLGPGYLLEGRPVILTEPRRAAPAATSRTASGSVAVPGSRARVARASRIYVEGRHDAELIAQVWGEDLRIEGVVVEHLGGVDDLVGIVAEFAPGPGRRLGVLVDHLVTGSKEARIAEAVRRGPGGPDTLVVGHPYVDIWQAVKPQRLGLTAWPDVPRHIEWKHGACQALRLPHADQADVARAWRRIRSRVRDWNDLEPALISKVEELIDFVTEPGR